MYTKRSKYSSLSHFSNGETVLVLVEKKKKSKKELCVNKKNKKECSINGKDGHCYWDKGGTLIQYFKNLFGIEINGKCKLDKDMSY